MDNFPGGFKEKRRKTIFNKSNRKQKKSTKKILVNTLQITRQK